MLHAFEGEQAFGAPTLEVIAELKRIYGCELTAADSHQLRGVRGAGLGLPAAGRPGGSSRRLACWPGRASRAGRQPAAGLLAGPVASRMGG